MVASAASDGHGGTLLSLPTSKYVARDGKTEHAHQLAGSGRRPVARCPFPRILPPRGETGRCAARGPKIEASIHASGIPTLEADEPSVWETDSSGHDVNIDDASTMGNSVEREATPEITLP